MVAAKLQKRGAYLFLVPAMYTVEAYSIAFNDGFTQIMN